MQRNPQLNPKGELQHLLSIEGLPREILLQILERYFAHTEETDAQLATLASAAITLMVWVLRPLGDLITTLPVGPA